MTSEPADAPETPYLAVDPDVLARNIRRAASAAEQGGFALRPHAKTHKIPEIGRLQLEAGAVGLTVATASEAEVFADAGVGDLFIAYPVWPSPGRARRLRALAERVILRLGVDSVESAQALGRVLPAGSVEVLVEVDPGHHRSGVQPEDAGAVAASAARAGLAIAGVFTFPGHSYAPGARERAGRDEAVALVAAAAALERSGLPAPVRSGGSTPSFAAADSAALTEARPGVYVFNDAQQFELGSCALDSVALTVHATVVSRSGHRVILDAGSKSLGADRPDWATGFGRLADDEGARIVALSEHHATVELPDGAEPPALGSILRVVPNHVCNTVNLADEVAVVRDGAIVDSWEIAARGANT